MKNDDGQSRSRPPSQVVNFKISGQNFLATQRQFFEQKLNCGTSTTELLVLKCGDVHPYEALFIVEINHFSSLRAGCREPMGSKYLSFDFSPANSLRALILI